MTVEQRRGEELQYRKARKNSSFAFLDAILAYESHCSP